MPTIDVHEAETGFSQILEQVQHGEEFTITKNGNPVASLTPFADNLVPLGGRMPDRGEILKASKDLDGLSEGITLGGLNIKDMIEKGRR